MKKVTHDYGIEYLLASPTLKNLTRRKRNTNVGMPMTHPKVWSSMCQQHILEFRVQCSTNLTIMVTSSPHTLLEATRIDLHLAKLIRMSRCEAQRRTRNPIIGNALYFCGRHSSDITMRRGHTLK